MDEATRKEVRRAATTLLPELPRFGTDVADHIVARTPGLAVAAIRPLVVRSCEANSAALLDGLLRGRPVETMPPSDEVVETTRAMIRGGVPIDVLMRGYRLGIAYWIERWTAAVAQSGGSLSAAAAGTRFLLGWLELIVELLGADAAAELGRIAAAGSPERRETVRALLAGDALDLATAARALGHDLAGPHVALAIRGDGVRAERLARDLAAPGDPLVVHVDLETTWCWLVVRASPEVPPGPLRVGIGRPGEGLDGFRRSHAEAVEALRVAELADRAVVAYERAEVAALCSLDPERCRSFVAGRLGPLAADDDRARRLRATLTAYLDEHANARRTAARLGLHHNTVRYRVTQAERLLGRPVEDDRLGLELALHLRRRLGAVGGDIGTKGMEPHE